jgi:hypothetical protein
MFRYGATRRRINRTRRFEKRPDWVVGRCLGAARRLRQRAEAGSVAEPRQGCDEAARICASQLAEKKVASAFIDGVPLLSTLSAPAMSGGAAEEDALDRAGQAGAWSAWRT